MYTYLHCSTFLERNSLYVVLSCWPIDGVNVEFGDDGYNFYQLLSEQRLTLWYSGKKEK
jgi:hypothetical protein